MPVTAHIHSNNTKIGSCPHGLPAGACPICNGMAGGNSTTKRDIPRNVGEMTYNECVAMGAMLRAIKNARMRSQNAEQNRLQAMANFYKNIEISHQKILSLSNFFTQHTPAIIGKPMNFVLNKLVGGTLNLVKNIPPMIQNLGQKLTDISDKLTAMFGEKKAAISKKISNSFKNAKQKLKSIFFIFGADETDDDEKKIEEAKRIFNLKKFIQKLRKNTRDINDES